MRFTTSSLAISKASCHSLVEDCVHKRLSSVSLKKKEKKKKMHCVRFHCFPPISKCKFSLYESMFLAEHSLDKLSFEC